MVQTKTESKRYLAFSQAEFTYTWSKNRDYIAKPIYGCVHTQNPLSMLDLAPIPCIDCLNIKANEMVAHLQRVHDQVKQAKQAIWVSNAKYKAQANNHCH